MGLLRVEHQVGLPELGEHLVNVFEVILEDGFGEDTNVVDEVQTVLLQQILKHNVHHTLVSSRSSAKSKRHDQKLNAVTSNKGCLLLIFWLYLHLPVTSGSIKSGKILSSMQDIKDFINERKWERVHPGYCIEFSEVNAEPHLAVLLLDQDNWKAPGLVDGRMMLASNILSTSSLMNCWPCSL